MKLVTALALVIGSAYGATVGFDGNRFQNAPTPNCGTTPGGQTLSTAGANGNVAFGQGFTVVNVEANRNCKSVNVNVINAGNKNNVAVIQAPRTGSNSRFGQIASNKKIESFQFACAYFLLGFFLPVDCTLTVYYSSNQVSVSNTGFGSGFSSVGKTVTASQNMQTFDFGNRNVQSMSFSVKPGGNGNSGSNPGNLYLLLDVIETA
ncbi:Hypothetical predicted protein [Lecanosticta acicola]|uniref:Uncharacterized protein n=1 Tax=Lecanosticta acicola TaxID=111012 RepID=A0AAI8YZ67_9PEZI|nr:Hypothetical predicted protein [Lecanosticta acicola]